MGGNDGCYNGLRQCRGYETYLQIAIDVHLLTIRYFSDHTKHNNFEVGEGCSPRFFVLVSGTEYISLVVYPASQMYVHYEMERGKLAELLCVDELSTTSFSVLVSHKYLQHGRRG